MDSPQRFCEEFFESIGHADSGQSSSARSAHALKGAVMDEDYLNNLSSQQLEESFHLLAADAREYAIFLLGQDGRLLCWNPGAERLFGYQPNENIGQHFSLLFSPEDLLTGQPEHELTRAVENGRADGVRWQVRKDGSRFWCRATVTPLRDEHKQVRSFARVIHDLTETQAQDAQKKRADDLAEANRSREEFMALLSHELRNPLSPILNALEILRRMRTNDPIIEQAGVIINRQVLQMVRLVDDLLDIGRITKGKLRLVKEKVELRVVANAAAETVRSNFDARKHDFSLSLPTAPLWAEADPARLEQIVVNLLNNAAKYSDPGGLIRMGVSQEGVDAVIRVRDNGVGIAPEMLPRIFDMFTQAEGALSHSHGGLGIGLALVRTLVEMQEGRVQAQSDGLGKGSEFTVKLPVVLAPSGHVANTVLEPGVNTLKLAAVLAWRPMSFLTKEIAVPSGGMAAVVTVGDIDTTTALGGIGCRTTVGCITTTGHGRTMRSIIRPPTTIRPLQSPFRRILTIIGTIASGGIRCRVTVGRTMTTAVGAMEPREWAPSVVKLVIAAC